MASRENIRLQLESTQLRQEISALRNQIDNLAGGQESNTPAEATHTRPSNSIPEPVPDREYLHRATRRSK